MRNKDKKQKNGYNYHLLIVINLTWTDVITMSGFHCIILPVNQLSVF